MSASLVGSEMCIRDRCALGAGPQGRREALDQSVGADDAAAALPHAGVGGCLLYTSDAADDM
eukprot:10081192-Alexandrium_andersonii.AAC.1